MALSQFMDAISIRDIKPTKDLEIPPEACAGDTKIDVRRNVHLSKQTCLDLIHFSEKLNTNQSKLIRTILNHVFDGWKQQKEPANAR